MPRPQRIGDVLAELVARRGLGRVQSGELLSGAWRQAVGEFAARHSRVGAVRRGVLEVVVAHSALVQELTFRKPDLLVQLARFAPDEQIRDLRFRCGAVA
jgi:predicted nucleic acid-binding Zn ribbon protein